uniref:tRNA (32-2'-O)-methyltransferase regulator THADA-like TPR repeats region domain-containing protein n=1 Tax=Romanomermis culicivorax TaxID=13658 RepID=A0A915HF34_ROMCU
MDVRVHLNRKFDKNNAEDVHQVEALKSALEKSNDTQEKFVISHVLWHVVLNCGWPMAEIFHRKYLSSLDTILLNVTNFEDANFDDLAFLNGFANVYLSSDGKFHDFSTKNSDEIFANLLHLTLKSSFKRKPIDFYWYFHVIDNLLKKYTKKKRTTAKIENLAYDFTRKIQILENLILKLTQANWDNKFPRVSELGVEIFENFYLIFGRSILRIKIDEMIFEYLNFYPFYVRGKFRMIAKLVEMANMEEFIKFERYLLDSLNLPASSNHLAPFVGTVYKTVLHFISKNLSQTGSEIVDRWLTIVVENLCDKNNQLRYNTMKHFVPAVVKYLPQFYESNLMTGIRRLHENRSKFFDSEENYLKEVNPRSLCSLIPFLEPKIDGLKNDGQNLNIEFVNWAYALLLKYSANVKEFKLSEKDRKFLEKALILRDDSTRIEAFDFCTDFSNDENEDRIFMSCELCLKFLAENFLVSDPSFRRRLVRSFSKYLNYCLTKTSKNLEKRILCVEFIRKCSDLCWKNLFPEANYQRMSSSLNILEAIVQNSISHNILSEISANFESNIEILIRGLQNSSGDIRESCGRILTKVYHNRPLNIDQSASKSELIEIATNLSNSPKELDCQSGAALWNLIFRKNIRNFEIESIFIDLKNRFEKLKRNVLIASSENPLHGFLTAAKIYLLANPCIELNLAQNFVEFCAQVTDFFNRMLGSSTEGECPSLEQMDVSLAKISLSNDFDDGNIDESDFNNDRQLVLACCWLNIK